jgi:Membrane protein involved in the export of O-antigen and teichoic acid
MTSRTSRAISGTLTSFVEFGLRIGLQAALAPLVLRVAGQETLGAYGALMQVVGYLALVDLGFGVALSRYMAQAFGYDDQKKRFSAIFTTGRTFYLASNCVVALFAFILSIYVGNLFSLSGPVETQARIGLWILAAWSVLRTPLAVYGGALIATQNLAAANIISVVGNALRLIISLGMVLLGFDLVGLMLADVFAEAVTFSLQRWQYRKTYPGERFGWSIPDWQLFREMLGFGIGYLLVTIGVRLTFNTDNLVVGYLYGGVATSIYYTTQMPTFLLIALIWKITDNATPAFNELYARKDMERLRNAYYKLIKYGLILSLGLGLGLLVLNRTLITLWVGESQYAGDLMTISLALFSVGAVISHVNGTVLVAYGAVRLLSIISIAGGVCNLVLSLLLGKTLGLQGVMVASAVVETVVVGVLWVYSLSLLKINVFSLWRKAVAPALLANLFLIPVVPFIYLYHQTVSWLMLMVWSFVFMAIWAIGTFTAGLDREELAHIRSYCGKIIITNR